MLSSSLLSSPWFPAAPWVALVVLSGLLVELFCWFTRRHLISHVMWWLVANYTIPTVTILVSLVIHFIWQRASVYAEYRNKTKVDS